MICNHNNCTHVMSDMRCEYEVAFVWPGVVSIMLFSIKIYTCKLRLRTLSSCELATLQWCQHLNGSLKINVAIMWFSRVVILGGLAGP